MKLAGYMRDDFKNGWGDSLSIFVQGCPHHCKGCHNPETWEFKDGPVDYNIYDLLSDISANGVQRNFSVLGGEPLCPDNIEMVAFIISTVRQTYPKIKITIWTGYIFETLKDMYENHPHFRYAWESILNNTDVIIDGPYMDELRDASLFLRGSSNQRILAKELGDF